MKSLFQAVKTGIDKKKQERELKLKVMESQIEQIQEQLNQKGFKVLHPVQAAKASKEIKRLEKEIEKLKKAHSQNVGILVSLCIVVVMMSFIGIMAAREKRQNMIDSNTVDSEFALDTEKKNTSGETDVDSESNAISSESKRSSVEAQIESSSEIGPDTNSEEKESISSEISDIPEDTQTETGESTSDLADNSEEADSSETVASSTASSEQESSSGWLPITAAQLDVRYTSEYVHLDRETVYLGQDEEVIFTIKANQDDFTIDNLLFFYDDELLDVSYEEFGYDGIIKVYVQGRVACDTFFGFCTAYGYDKYGENTSFIRVEIKQLNETDGRVVYVTETGEKYHFSETCAGEYAIATTYLDATSAGYEPCGKCAD